MRDEDVVRLRHMLDAAKEALKFTQGRRREDLDHDRQLEWALVKAIEIVGEAAGQVSEETRVGIPSIPWRNIVGMRNRLIHVYFDINRDILWKTVMEGLPPIIAELERVLQENA